MMEEKKMILPFSRKGIIFQASLMLTIKFTAIQIIEYRILFRNVMVSTTV